MWPSRSVSSTSSAASRRDGTSKYWRFWLPQLLRKSITSLSARTARTISAFSSVPLPSLSMRRKALRAALRNSSENSLSAAAAARARRSCSALSCSMRFARPRLMASSLRAKRRQTNDTKPDGGRRATRHSSASTSPLLSVSRISKAFCSRGGWSKNCRFSSPHVLRNLITFCERREV